MVEEGRERRFRAGLLQKVAIKSVVRIIVRRRTVTYCPAIMALLFFLCQTNHRSRPASKDVGKHAS